MGRILPLLCILLCSLYEPQLSAQVLFDVSDTSLFPESLEKFFATSSEKKKAKAFLESFDLFWESSAVSPALKSQIIQTANKLAAKKGRPFPDYYHYLTTVQSFVTRNHNHESFECWHRAINNLLDQPRYPLRHLNVLFETTNNILSEQKLFSTPGVDWYSRSPEYRFEYQDTLKLVVHSTQLVCRSKNDSIVIYNTGGTLYPETGLWRGTKGKITWERCGLDPEQVYANLQTYAINMKKSSLEADRALFYNKKYFPQPMTGLLEHKVMNIRTPESSTYPRFESSGEQFRIPNLHPGINYEGGFCQRGSKILGSGTHQQPATITIFRNDSLFVTARSLTFSLEADQILSNNTEITIQLDTGFVYHPGLIFKYMVKTNELSLIRNGEGISQSPFFDTYHNISIDSEIIKWDRSSDFMELRMLRGAAENHAFFESLSYYRESFYNFLQGMDAIHPLQGLKNFSQQNHSNAFTALDYARFLNLPENAIRQQILKLSFYGFVGYNTNTDTISIRERLNDYLLFRQGKKDYDVIRFKSLTPGKDANAIFNLVNHDLMLNGVNAISICDHQNVVFFPKDEKITLKYNRNFSFDGDIKAGMIELYGNGFRFSYENFRIDMEKIDSMRMMVMTDQLDYTGQPKHETIKNTLAQLSGYLQIDTANNKSGKDHYPQYPILASNSSSFVYYNHPDIQDGAYDSEAFYFEATPFKMDSINQLNESNIAFEGKLVSNIFPEIEQNLVVRDDLSLGFEKQSPPEGYPIYNQQARYLNTIDLSNKGLMGNGTLEYLNSKSQSESFTFLPEETKGQAFQFDITPQATGIEYPDVQGKYIEISYLPEAEELQAKSQEEPFTLYEKQTTLEGSLCLTPTILKAKGKLNMPEASLVSAKMELSHHALLADSSDFNLVGKDQVEGITFKTTNLISQIDFQERQGRFSSHGQGNKVEFTENKYVSFINEFSWDMDKNNIFMGAKGSKGNRFVSTHRKQDSLDFYAPLARYDVEAKTIEASEVKEIRVADANILLGDGRVKILANAEMTPLDSASIVLLDSLHTFTNARVTIMGKKQYSAFGEYEFINGNQKRETIDFHNISTNKDAITTADGEINAKQTFTFDHHFAYQGEVHLTSGDTLLTFDGGVQLLHPCSNNGPQAYTRFKAPIDPNNIRIPIGKETQNYDHENLYHDFFLSLDSVHVYSSFLEGREAYNDVPIISANGFLTYNDLSKSFDLADAQKLATPESAGPILRYHEEGCYVSGEGPIQLGLDLDPVTLKAAGTVTDLLANDSISLSLMLGLDFFMDAKSSQMIADAIKASKAPEAKLDSARLMSRLIEWTDPKVAEKLLPQIKPSTETINGLPEEAQHTLSFTDINLSWDTSSKSYLSDGEAQLGWIKDRAIARQITVKTILTQSRGGNTLELYLEADPNTWFFFSYANNKMQTRSSLKPYNTYVQALDTDERKEKTKKNDKSYVYILAPQSRMDRFMQKFDTTPPPDDTNYQIPENETNESDDEPRKSDQ